MKNIAIIPARSGSKGIKDKNIKPLCGKPLMAYTIEAALECGLFQTVMVSTDSKEYGNIAKKYGAEVPFYRSQETSGDTSGSWEVVREVLHRYMENGEKFDTVCLLQPTSPLRRPSDIHECYQLLKDKEADAITSVCQVDHGPELMMTLLDDLSLAKYRERHGFNLQRQLQEQYYRINGAVYIRRVLYNKNDIMVLDKKEYACIMDPRYSVDVDTDMDFVLAEALVLSNAVNL